MDEIPNNKTNDPIAVIEQAKTPADFAWAYLLVTTQNNQQLMESFLLKMEKQNIDDNGWNIIGGWCSNLGLDDLKTKVFHIPPYVPVFY